jgi:hypothetical protein
MAPSKSADDRSDPSASTVTNSSVDCPSCGSTRIVPIVHGLRAIGLVEADADGEVEIADVTTAEGGRWACKACAHRWSEDLTA